MITKPIVPIKITINEYVYIHIANGCISIKTPIKISAVERFSQITLLNIFLKILFFFRHYFLTAPNVIPLRRCFLNTTVKIITGIKNKVVPAPIAGQSNPPSPIIVGIKGGAV